MGNILFIFQGKLVSTVYATGVDVAPVPAR